MRRDIQHTFRLSIKFDVAKECYCRGLRCQVGTVPLATD